MRCLLVEMDGVVQGASEDDLGGKRLAKVVVRLLGKAKTFSGEPTASKRLKKASKQLKILSAKLTKAVTKHKANADLVAELTAHAGEAQNVLAGLVGP